MKWSSLEGKRKVRGKLVRNLQARGHPQEQLGGACGKVTCRKVTLASSICCYLGRASKAAPAAAPTGLPLRDKVMSESNTPAPALTPWQEKWGTWGLGAQPLVGQTIHMPTAPRAPRSSPQDSCLPCLPLNQPRPEHRQHTATAHKWS